MEENLRGRSKEVLRERSTTQTQTIGHPAAADPHAPHVLVRVWGGVHARCELTLLRCLRAAK